MSLPNLSFATLRYFMYGTAVSNPSYDRHSGPRWPSSLRRHRATRWPIILTVLLGLLASSPTATNLGARTLDPVWRILWQSDGGSLGAWLLTGNAVSDDWYLTPSQVPPDWRVVGLADFDGNGSNDVLFRRVTTGELAVWYMDHLVKVQTGSDYMTPSVVPMNWAVVATDDFNGDDKTDIVWQEDSGFIGIWYMDGARMTSSTYVTPNQVPPAWRIAGAADLNNDGQSDLVFRHTGGTIAVWFMNSEGRMIDSAYVTNGVLDGNWQIVAIADFDNDSQPDFLFHSVSTQSLFIVYLEYLGGMVQQKGLGEYIFSPGVPPANWKVVGAR